MRHTRVFVNLAEQILTVNQLKAAAPERLEVEAEAFELSFLQVGHQPDELGFVQSARIDEALANAIARARTRYDEVHLTEIG